MEINNYSDEDLKLLMKKYKENSLKRDIYYQEIKEQNLKDNFQKNKAKEQEQAQEQDVKEKLFNEEDTWTQRKKED